jgi:hypothetical protein
VGSADKHIHGLNRVKADIVLYLLWNQEHPTFKLNTAMRSSHKWTQLTASIIPVLSVISGKGRFQFWQDLPSTINSCNA